MKKIFALLLAMLLCVGMASVANAATITPSQPVGSGTEADPYRIGTAAELYWYAKNVNSSSTVRKSHAELTADITVNQSVLNTDGSLSSNASDFDVWVPIGNAYGSAYTGHFDGKGYTISGLYYVGAYNTSTYVGFFGHVGANAVIKNVTIADSYFSGKDAGGIAGQVSVNGATFENCHNKATVVAHTTGNGGMAGGIIASTKQVTITGCSNAGVIYINTDYAPTKNETSKAGGLVGSGSGITMKDSYNTGSVTGISWVGGLVGMGSGAIIIEKCYNTGTITGNPLENMNSTGIYVGGILGYHNSTTASEIKDCYNVGSITGANYVGGLAGSFSWTNDKITNGHNYGSVSSGKKAYGFSSVTAATNCYYLNTLPEDKNAVAKSAESFKDGTLVTLLNAGRTGSEAVWTQGENYPVFGEFKAHEHSWTYSVDSANNTIITAACDAADCSDTNGGSVSIAAPTALTYTGNPIEAVVEDSLTTGDTVTVIYSGDGLVDGKPVNPGEYTAAITLEGAQISVSYTIAKAEPVVIAPQAKPLRYTGEAQPLVTEGSAGDCKMEYSLDGENYSDSVPAAADAGIYTVHYRVIGNSIYNGAAAKTVSVSIAKAEAPDITYPTASDVNYGQTLEDSELSGGSTQYGSFAWTDSAIVPSVGNSGYSVTFTPDENTLKNYGAIPNTTMTVAVAVNPKPLTASDIALTLADSNYVYDGTDKTPTITLKDGETALVPDADYQVKDGSTTTAKKIGTYTITLTGVGNYTGNISATWSISKIAAPAAPTGLEGAAPTTGLTDDGQITGTTAQMEYAAQPDFSDAKPCGDGVTTNLASGTYYVRMAATETTEPGAFAVVNVPAYQAPAISFDANGGEVAVSSMTTEPTGKLASLPVPTRTGYTFGGWFTEAQDGIQITTDTYFPASVTIYAHWTINQYTITFNTDGGSEIAPITQDYGTPVTAPENPTKAGYTFVSWVDEAGNIVTFPLDMPVDGMNLTAVWNLIPVADLPQTGDNSALGLWTLMMSLAGVALLVPKRRKN